MTVHLYTSGPFGDDNSTGVERVFTNEADAQHVVDAANALVHAARKNITDPIDTLAVTRLTVHTFAPKVGIYYRAMYHSERYNEPITTASRATCGVAPLETTSDANNFADWMTVRGPNRADVIAEANRLATLVNDSLALADA